MPLSDEKRKRWQQAMDILFDLQCRQTQIVSHRGKFSSSVMENTSLAFITAINQGADMVEMDLQKTKDGVIVGHHDDSMMRLFHRPGKISEYTAAELKAMDFFNYINEPCAEQMETFEEMIEPLINRTVLVLDKCWDCWDEVYLILKKKEMLKQAIFKFYTKDLAAFKWASAHTDCIFIPMLDEMEHLDRVLALKEKVKVPAVEIMPERETDEVFQKETLEDLRRQGLKIWCNSLSLSRDMVYGAGYDDIKALRYGGDCGWGHLVELGVDMIQTDWPFELALYLRGRAYQ